MAWLTNRSPRPPGRSRPGGGASRCAAPKACRRWKSWSPAGGWCASTCRKTGSVWCARTWSGAPPARYNKRSQFSMKHGFPASVLFLVCAAVPAYAQLDSASAALSPELPFAIEGPAPPALPATIARDGDGRVTLRAVRLTTPLRVDGQLDEALYSSNQPATDFVQMEPAHGQPASE